MTKLLNESEAKTFRFSPDAHRGIPWRLSFPTRMTEGPFPGGRKPKKVFPPGKHTWPSLGSGAKGGQGSGNICRGIGAGAIRGCRPRTPSRSLALVAGFPASPMVPRVTVQRRDRQLRRQSRLSEHPRGSWAWSLVPRPPGLDHTGTPSKCPGCSAWLSTAPIGARWLHLDRL